MARRVGSTEDTARASRSAVTSSAAGPTSRALFLLLPLFVMPGCVGVSAREPWLTNAIASHQEQRQMLAGVSPASSAVLEAKGLSAQSDFDPASTAAALEAQLAAEPQSEPDGALALAQLSYQAGLERESAWRGPKTAAPWYRDAATLAWIALRDPATTDRDLAVEIHNGALARLVRAARLEESRNGTSWRNFFTALGISQQNSGSFLDPRQIADLRVASDLNVKGMDHMYRCDGFGVPLVVHRVTSESSTNSSKPGDRFLPRELRTSATAMLVTSSKLTGYEWRNSAPTFVLIDPFTTSSVITGAGRAAPMARDVTTALASQVAGNRIAVLEWTGLIDSDFQKLNVDTGLYMLHPYERGKIPIVFVHGLSSSPRAWIQTVNELRNNPQFASKYQYWLFMYPTGLPIPTSARSLRQALVSTRDELDPEHIEPTLDNMVLVGHSMGGVLSKMMVQDSGSTLWNAMITVPRDQFKAPPELRETIEELMIFEPLPFVRRVVFIATPHRGSPVANGPIGNLFSALIRRPTEQTLGMAQVEALNGPNAISPELHNRPLNSIGNLRTDSSILLALDRIPIEPSVPYHSIIPLVGAVTHSDLVVRYSSSRIAGARTEQVVPGTHFSQQDPVVTHELEKILRVHLAESESLTGTPQQ